MGIKSLITGTFHPAAYVFLANAINVKDAFKSFHFDPEISIKPTEIYNQTISYITSGNATNALTRIGKQFQDIDLGNISSSIKSSFFDHAVEWQSAAAWGATTTIAHMALKKVPGIKHHEYLRLSLATVIGVGMTIAGYQYALEQELPLTHFLEIAYKVAIIGIPMKVINCAGQGGLNFTYASAEKIASVVKESCAFGLATLEFFEWKGPEKIRPQNPRRSTPPPETGDLQISQRAPSENQMPRAATMPARSPPPQRSSSPSPERKAKNESPDSD